MNLLKSGEHRFTLYFGKQRLNNSEYNHTGIDMVRSPSGLDYVIAAAKGKVIKVVNSVDGYRKNSYGNYVILEHSGGIKTLYAHMKRNSITVREGQIVNKGDTLGYMGNTGVATGNHLHFEVRVNDKAVDPIPYFQDKIDIVGYGEGENSTSNGNKQYVKANYRCNYNMKIRTGAGTNFKEKQVSELTSAGKKNATLKSGIAAYRIGTIFTALEIISNQDGSLWARSPSGYICLKDNTTIYCDIV